MTFIRTALIVACTGLGAIARADEPIALTDPAPNPAAALGTALAFHPSWAIVGAASKRSPDAQGLPSSFGAVLFWPRLASGAPTGDPITLLPAAPKRAARFGESIAVDGDLVAIGSPGYDGAFPAKAVGRVTIATCTPAPAILATIAPPGAALSALEFGASVALHDSMLVVGAPGWGTNFNLRFGAVYVYVDSSGTGQSWTLALPDPGSDNVPQLKGTAVGQFGASVAINSSTIAVGAPSGGIDIGRVWLFDRNNFNAAPIELTAPSPYSGDRFGATMAMHEDLLVVSAAANDCENGAVHVYRRIKSAWMFETTLAQPDEPGWIGFGNSIALERERVVIGSGGVRGATNVGGKVAVFRRAGKAWTLEATSAPIGSEPDDPSGGTVSIDATGILRTDPLISSGVVNYVPLPRSTDLDFDGQVSASDLGILLGAWDTSLAFADLDADGIVGAGDLAVLLGAWSTKR